MTLIEDTTNPIAGGTSTSSLLSPHTGITRTSYLTIDSGGSRISGLSAFPRPPSEQSADILASYFVEEVEGDPIPESISAALQGPADAAGESDGEWIHAL